MVCKVIKGGVRSFIAIELPSNLKEALIEIQKKIRNDIPKARFVKPAAMHLTLKFLGDVNPETLNRISNNFQSWIHEFKPYSLYPSSLGVFPNHRRARVLWTGFRDIITDHFRLVETIETELCKLGFPKEKNTHTPHLTLARFSDPGDAISIDRILEMNGILKFPELPVRNIYIYKSDLRPTGAVYTKLHEIIISS